MQVCLEVFQKLKTKIQVNSGTLKTIKMSKKQQTKRADLCTKDGPHLSHVNQDDNQNLVRNLPILSDPLIDGPVLKPSYCVILNPDIEVPPLLTEGHWQKK